MVAESAGSLLLRTTIDFDSVDYVLKLLLSGKKELLTEDVNNLVSFPPKSAHRQVSVIEKKGLAKTRASVRNSLLRLSVRGRSTPGVLTALCQLLKPESSRSNLLDAVRYSLVPSSPGQLMARFGHTCPSGLSTATQNFSTPRLIMASAQSNSSSAPENVGRLSWWLRTCLIMYRQLCLRSELQIFGAFVSSSWEKGNKSYYGDGETFVFSLKPTSRVYNWTKSNDLFMLTKDDVIAIGGGFTVLVLMRMTAQRSFRYLA
jgi:hypothetical protein